MKREIVIPQNKNEIEERTTQRECFPQNKNAIERERNTRREKTVIPQCLAEHAPATN